MSSRLKKQHRRGTTTVEFALTAPILFLFVLSAVEFSRANIIQHSAIVAATEGARRSIVPGATAEECLAAAQSELDVVGIKTATVEVEPSEITNDTEQVSIYIAVPLDGRNGFVLPGFLSGKTIEKSVTLQREAARSNSSTESAYKPKAD